MSSSRPKLSIITVVFNHKAQFMQTLQSIASQTFKDFEWVVIDGGSTDGTLDRIKEHDNIISSWISEPDKGIFDAMNKGLGCAKGEWITFLNAGDTYTSTASLNDIFSYAKTHIKFMYTDMFLLTESGKKIRKIKAEKLTKHSISKGMIACHQGMFIRKEVCPFYDTRYYYQGDLEWTIRILFLLSQNEICYIPKDHIFYKNDGFSNQSLINQLKTHLSLIYKYYGFLMILYRIPRLFRRYIGKWLRKCLGIHTLRFWIKAKHNDSL
ncbi:hypothetical protein DID78_05250 [Candidatus Marinamargulisbacteria bacterium SCGC AG-343-D04]|nr:hypothetical protein DID78_05250 [Candidatus Marinamargulisbacteria bacterium SCGC AG-343-D04]